MITSMSVVMPVKFGVVGGGGEGEEDVKNCAYLRKNPGYAPAWQVCIRVFFFFFGKNYVETFKNGSE